MSYSNEMFREIILEHVKTPKNKNKEHNNYIEFTLKNPSCGDIVTIFVKVNNNTIEDITYNIEGCSICTASTSIMSELLNNKTIDEMNLIVENFTNMITGKSYNESTLEEAICLSGIKDVPTRIKCAILPYKALTNAVRGENDGL